MRGRTAARAVPTAASAWPPRVGPSPHPTCCRSCVPHGKCPFPALHVLWRETALGYKDPAGDRPPQLPGAGAAGSHPVVARMDPEAPLMHPWQFLVAGSEVCARNLGASWEGRSLRARGLGQGKYPDGQRSLGSLGTEPTLGTATVPAPKGPTDSLGSQTRSTQPSLPRASLEELHGAPCARGSRTPGTREVGASGLPFSDTLARTAWPAFAWRQREESVPWPLPHTGPRTPGEGQQQRGHGDGHSAEAAGRRCWDSGGPGSLGAAALTCVRLPLHISLPTRGPWAPRGPSRQPSRTAGRLRTAWCLRGCDRPRGWMGQGQRGAVSVLEQEPALAGRASSRGRCGKAGPAPGRAEG